MWILSGDKKRLIDAKFFKIAKNTGGGKDKKWVIVAYSQTAAEMTLTGVMCTFFKDEDRAITELERVAAFAEENPEKVYKFNL